MTKFVKRFLLLAGDKNNIALLLILILAAYLRLWDISHFFNVLHDSDEGVYAVVARLISSGYIPYKDFVTVHPPLFELALGAIYKVFGYSFLYGRYFSAVLSLATIVLAYLIGRKLYYSTAGIAAAAVFAVYPEMVYWGRSLTQESLGIFLIVSCIYLVSNISGETGKIRFFLSGALLGLAAATKYTFIPAICGVAAGAVVLNSGERFRDALQPLARRSVWLIYLSLLAVVFALLAICKYVLGWPVTVPFVDVGLQSVVNSISLPVILILILIISLLAVYGRAFTRELAVRIWRLGHKAAAIWLISGLFIGFLAVTGFFWVKMPGDYIHQTLSMQTNQEFYFPSLPALIANALVPRGFLATGSYFILLALAAAIILLRKRKFGPADFFLAASMLVTLLVCQWYPAVARYYVSLFPFFLLVIASFTPRLDSNILKSNLSKLNFVVKRRLTVISSMMVLFLGLSLILILINPVYDTTMLRNSSDENRVYRDTINYLEAVGARKICSPNQILPALAPQFASSLNVDYYAFRILDPQSPEKIIQNEIDQGAEYILLDYWARFWKDDWTSQMREVIYKHSRLVTIIHPESDLNTQIYWLKAPSGIINGQFDKWAYTGNFNTPFGWLPMIGSEDREQALLEEKVEQGVKAVSLSVFTEGTVNANKTYTGLLQYSPFPDGKVTIRAIPGQSTQLLGTDIIGPSIQFFDSSGHTISLGFSNQIEKEEAATYAEGNKMLVLMKSDLDHWQDYTFDVRSYWARAGWELPRSSGIYINESTAAAGNFTFYVAEISAR